jgi:thermitase
MRRRYRLRGRIIELDELETVSALPPPLDDAPGGAAFANAVPSAEHPAPAAAGDLGLEPELRSELAPFERAGWQVIGRPVVLEALALGAEADSLPSSSTAGAQPIYRYAESPRSVVIGTDLVTLRLAKWVTEDGEAELHSRHGLEVVRHLRFAPRLSLVRVPHGTNPFDVVERLLEDEGERVVYAEPCLVESLGQLDPRAPSFTTSDAAPDAQWQWHNVGQSGGTKGADVKAHDAWSRTDGGGVVIGIVDNGFNLLPHELVLAGSVRQPLALARPGHFRDAPESVTFVVGGQTPTGAHGTFCAALAVARRNDVSGCGIAPGADLLPVACLPDQTGTQVTLARALAYAVEPDLEGEAGRGADILSCSLGSANGAWRMQSVLQDALLFAASGRGTLGVPVFWAVANVDVPIAADEVNASGLTVPVGSSDHDDARATCGFGPELAFLAPGQHVVATLPDETLTTITGTSYATPSAAGIAALVLSVNPALRAAEIVEILEATCDAVPAQDPAMRRDDRHGFGRLNAARAVDEAIARRLQS